MASWIVKAVVQKALSLLPAAHVMNRALQDRVTGSLDLEEDRLSDQLRRCARHLDAYRRLRGGVPERVLEVGTGWAPVLPLGFHLSGCREIWTADRTPLMRAADAARAVRALAQLHREGRLEGMLAGLVAERGARLVERAGELERSVGRAAPSAASLLEEFGIHYRVGALDGMLPGPGCMNLTVTNSVLEHLPESDLVELLQRLRHLTSATGVASHFIDLGDHYAVFDPGVDVYNFLKFSDAAWAMINSRLHYQSRLRISDYRRLLHVTGWRIVEEASQRGSRSDLAGIPLAPRFRACSLDDLLVYRAWIIALPAEPPLRVAAV